MLSSRLDLVCVLPESGERAQTSLAVFVRTSVATAARVCRAAEIGRFRFLARVGLDTASQATAKHTYAGWEWMHVAIDDHSRVAYVEMLPADHAATAAASLRHAQRWFAQQRVRIRRVLTDNGSGYISRQFAHTCETSRSGANELALIVHKRMERPSS